MSLTNNIIKIDYYNYDENGKEIDIHNQRRFVECEILDKINSWKRFEGEYYDYGQRNSGFKKEYAVVTAYLCRITHSYLRKDDIGKIIEVLPNKIIEILQKK